MFSNRSTFAPLAVACIAAAGAGGYFASRQNTVPTPAAALTQSAPGSTEAPSVDHPVQETEGVVGDAAAKTPAAPDHDAPKATLATSRRIEPARTAATASGRSASSRAQQESPSFDRTSPASGVSQSPGSAPTASETNRAAATLSDDRAAQEQTRPPEPPHKTFEELVVSANSVIGLQTETRISSETARIEDRVDAKVTRDVKVGDKIAIPAGSRVIGSVVQVDRGGKFKDRARLGIRFTTIVLADGTRTSMSTETIYRDGEAPGNSSAAKIGGGAVGGAILGAILGGAKGAAIGATAGAGGGAAVVEAGDRREVTLPAGSPMTVRLLAPVAVTVEQN